MPPHSLILLQSGTPAPLLSNPALTDTLSNLPLRGSQAGNRTEQQLGMEDGLNEEANS